MKKKVLYLLILLISCLSANAQIESYATAWSTKKATINVAYLNNYPYSYKNDAGVITGIEIDIINEFAKWLKEKKGIEVTIKYEQFEDFSIFYDNIKNRKTSTIGAGSVTKTMERAREIKFSSVYLKNKAIMISASAQPSLSDVRSISKEFAGCTAIVVKGSTHERLMKNLKDTYFPELKVETAETSKQVIEKIVGTPKYFGYVDIVTYWSSLKEDDKPLKFHRMPPVSDEYFGLIFSKTSDWQNPFNEFFDAGLGFTDSDEFNEILRKHLGLEIIKYVQIVY